jgi:hypothetical protein
VSSAAKPVGKPDAGNPHVRFDERGEETGRLAKPQVTAPLLDFTPTMSTCPGRVAGSACTSSFSRLAQRSLTLRPRTPALSPNRSGPSRWWKLGAVAARPQTAIFGGAVASSARRTIVSRLMSRCCNCHSSCSSRMFVGRFRTKDDRARFGNRRSGVRGIGPSSIAPESCAV